MSTEPQSMTKREKKGERGRLKVMRRLDELGGRATTSQIDDEVGIGNAMVRHYCKQLEEQRDPPQVVKDGTKSTGSNALSDTNIYRLTERGKEVVDAMDDEKFTVEEAETFVELRSELASTKEELADLRKAHDNFIKAIQRGELDEHLNEYLE